MRTLISLLACFLFTPGLALAADGGPAPNPTVAEVMVAPPSGTVAVDTDLDHKPIPKDLATEVGEIVAAVDKLQDAGADKAGLALAIAAMIAAIGKLLLSLLKLASGFFKKRNVPRVIALGLGVVVFAAATVVGGASWWEALIMAGGGPGMILFHELTKLIPVSDP